MKINVLALGDSLKHYKPDGSVTVGVNDIFKYHPVDYLVLLDPPNRFTEKDRLKTIMESAPKKFYSNFKWNVNNFHLFETAKRGSVAELDTDKICLSLCSPFTACVIAYKLGAKQIHIYGADYTTHPVLSRESTLEKTLENYKKLNLALRKRGVIMKTTKESQLAKILPLI